MGAIADDMAAERRGATALDDAQEFTLPASGVSAGAVRQRGNLCFDAGITGTALRRQRALARRRHPPFGREIYQRKRREVDLQATEPRGREHDGVDVLTFGE